MLLCSIIKLLKLLKNGFSIETEASGGITVENIAQYKGCGVNFISSGELTNDIHALDISF